MNKSTLAKSALATVFVAAALGTSRPAPADSGPTLSAQVVGGGSDNSVLYSGCGFTPYEQVYVYENTVPALGGEYVGQAEAYPARWRIGGGEVACYGNMGGQYYVGCGRGPYYLSAQDSAGVWSNIVTLSDLPECNQ